MIQREVARERERGGGTSSQREQPFCVPSFGDHPAYRSTDTQGKCPEMNEFRRTGLRNFTQFLRLLSKRFAVTLDSQVKSSFGGVRIRKIIVFFYRERIQSTNSFEIFERLFISSRNSNKICVQKTNALNKSTIKSSRFLFCNEPQLFGKYINIFFFLIQLRRSIAT